MTTRYYNPYSYGPIHFFRMGDRAAFPGQRIAFRENEIVDAFYDNTNRPVILTPGGCRFYVTSIKPEHIDADVREQTEG